MNRFSFSSQIRNLLLATTILAAPLHVLAEDEIIAAGNVTIRPMTLKEDGSIAPMDAKDLIKSMKTNILAVEQRLQSELPAIVGTDKFEVDLVSVPSSKMPGQKNPTYLLFHTNPEAAAFIPFLGRAVTRKVDVYVSMEARIRVPGKPVVLVLAESDKQVEYRRGLATTAFGTVVDASGPIFDDATSKLIEGACQKYRANAAATAQPAAEANPAASAAPLQPAQKGE